MKNLLTLLADSFNFYWIITLNFYKIFWQFLSSKVLSVWISNLDLVFKFQFVFFNSQKGPFIQYNHLWFQSANNPTKSWNGKSWTSYFFKIQNREKSSIFKKVWRLTKTTIWQLSKCKHKRNFKAVWPG